MQLPVSLFSLSLAFQIQLIANHILTLNYSPIQISTKAVVYASHDPYRKSSAPLEIISEYRLALASIKWNIYRYLGCVSLSRVQLNVVPPYKYSRDYLMVTQTGRQDKTTIQSKLTYFTIHLLSGNRIKPFSYLLQSLLNTNFTLIDKTIDIYIHIDGDATSTVIKVAKSFLWPFGRKYLNIKKTYVGMNQVPIH